MPKSNQGQPQAHSHGVEHAFKLYFQGCGRWTKEQMDVGKPSNDTAEIVDVVDTDNHDNGLHHGNQTEQIPYTLQS